MILLFALRVVIVAVALFFALATTIVSFRFWRTGEHSTAIIGWLFAGLCLYAAGVAA